MLPTTTQKQNVISHEYLKSVLLLTAHCAIINLCLMNSLGFGEDSPLFVLKMCLLEANLLDIAIPKLLCVLQGIVRGGE